MFVVDSNKYKAGVGGVVTVYGVGFNDSCVVRIGGRDYAPVDFDDEYIRFAAPSELGTYSFEILDGVSSSGELTLYVVEYEELCTTKLPERHESSFVRMIDGLMPRGFAWEYENGSNWSKLIAGIALVLAYLYDMLQSLVQQMSPVSTNELGPWENELALPWKGITRDTDEGRKGEIIRVARKQGGATIPYLKSIMELMDVNYDIFEYAKTPAVFPTWVSSKYGNRAGFVVMVKVYRDSYYPYGMNCKSPCNSSFGRARDKKIESVLDRVKHAHVKIIYSYVVRVLTDMNGNPIVPSSTDQRMIIV